MELKNFENDPPAQIDLSLSQYADGFVPNKKSCVIDLCEGQTADENCHIYKEEEKEEENIMLPLAARLHQIQEKQKQSLAQGPMQAPKAHRPTRKRARQFEVEAHGPRLPAGSMSPRGKPIDICDLSQVDTVETSSSYDQSKLCTNLGSSKIHHKGDGHTQFLKQEGKLGRIPGHLDHHDHTIPWLHAQHFRGPGQEGDPAGFSGRSPSYRDAADGVGGRSQSYLAAVARSSNCLSGRQKEARTNRRTGGGSSSMMASVPDKSLVDARYQKDLAQGENVDLGFKRSGLDHHLDEKSLLLTDADIALAFQREEDLLLRRSLPASGRPQSEEDLRIALAIQREEDLRMDEEIAKHLQKNDEASPRFQGDMFHQYPQPNHQRGLSRSGRMPGWGTRQFRSNSVSAAPHQQEERHRHRQPRPERGLDSPPLDWGHPLLDRMAINLESLSRHYRRSSSRGSRGGPNRSIDRDPFMGSFGDWGMASNLASNLAASGISPSLVFSDRDFTPEDYEALCRLDDKVESRRGVSQSAIDTLPTHVVRRRPLGPSGPTAGSRFAAVVGDDTEPIAESMSCCSICLEDVVDGAVMRLLPCTHQFHQDCIDKWLKQRGTCPICQRPCTE